MDSSNAEKAWEAREGLFTGAPQEARAFIAADRAGFMAGHTSRDAEVDELTRLLAESRSRYGDLEARLTEAQAVIAKARKHLDIVFGENSVHMSTMRRILTIEPSVVLEDRDRENRAIGWDEGYDAGRDDESFDARGLSTDGDADQHPHANPYRGDNR